MAAPQLVPARSFDMATGQAVRVGPMLPTLPSFHASVVPLVYFRQTSCTAGGHAAAAAATATNPGASPTPPIHADFNRRNRLPARPVLLRGLRVSNLSFADRRKRPDRLPDRLPRIASSVLGSAGGAGWLQRDRERDPPDRLRQRLDTLCTARAIALPTLAQHELPSLRSTPRRRPGGL